MKPLISQKQAEMTQMKYVLLLGSACWLLFGCQSASKFQPAWLSDPSKVIYSSQYDGKVLVRVKAKVTQAEFEDAIERLKMAPLSAEKDYPATLEEIRWKRGPSRKWDPLPTLDNTFLVHHGDLWETAKYENGFLYYQLLNLEN